MEKNIKSNIIHLDTYKYLGQEWCLSDNYERPTDMIAVQSTEGWLILCKNQEIIQGLNKGKILRSPMLKNEIGMING